MSPELQEFVFKALGTISWPGAILGVAYLGYLSLPYFRRGSNSEATVQELVEFKEVQEGNHNTDLAELMRWRKDTVEPALRDFQQMGKDIAYIKGRINGHNPSNASY